MLRNSNYIYENIIVADEINTTKQYCKKAQVGVDLSIRSIESMEVGCTLRSKTYAASTRNIDKKEYSYNDEVFTGWFLPQGTYIVKLNEGCNFGPKDTGLIVLRSSLNRSGFTVCSAVWDPGYKSVDGDTIYPMSVRLTIDNPNGFYLEENARIAQLLVLENEDTTLYNGQWQGGKTISKLVQF